MKLKSEINKREKVKFHCRAIMETLIHEILEHVSLSAEVKIELQ